MWTRLKQLNAKNWEFIWNDQFLEKYPKLPKRTEEKNFMNIPLTFNDCLKISPQIKYQSQVFAYRLANIQETNNFNLI